MVELRPDDFVAAATEQTRLSDFGSDSYREGLDLFCSSAQDEAELNDIGAMVVPGAVVGALANRLRVVDWAKQHPEVADEQIEAPWMVIGLFRAGTTLASYLLEKDERSRPLLRWEVTTARPHPSAIIATIRASRRSASPPR